MSEGKNPEKPPVKPVDLIDRATKIAIWAKVDKTYYECVEAELLSTAGTIARNLRDKGLLIQNEIFKIIMSPENKKRIKGILCDFFTKKIVEKELDLE